MGRSRWALFLYFTNAQLCLDNTTGKGESGVHSRHGNEITCCFLGYCKILKMYQNTLVCVSWFSSHENGGDNLNWIKTLGVKSPRLEIQHIISRTA